VCADGLNLPFADNSFDIVYCMDYLHHVSDIQKAANELLRISKNVVVIIEPNKFNPIYFIYALLCKEERGILDVGYKKIKKIFPHNEIEFIEPLPFHAIIGRTFPYRVLSKIFETLKLTRLFATYVLIAKK
jgi:SAM-dependent methyltransferase